MRLVKGALVLVVDGGRVLVMRNAGDALDPALEVVEHRTHPNPANRDWLADAPGLAFSTGHPGRSTTGKADPHQASEDRFFEEALVAAGELAQREAADLIVVAPPRALGILRAGYTPALRARLVAEIGKDLAKHPVDEIARLLNAYEFQA